MKISVKGEQGKWLNFSLISLHGENVVAWTEKPSILAGSVEWMDGDNKKQVMAKHIYDGINNNSISGMFFGLYTCMCQQQAQPES